jgi:hypothetical protein
LAADATDALIQISEQEAIMRDVLDAHAAEWSAVLHDVSHWLSMPVEEIHRQTQLLVGAVTPNLAGLVDQAGLANVGELTRQIVDRAGLANVGELTRQIVDQAGLANVGELTRQIVDQAGLANVGEFIRQVVDQARLVPNLDELTRQVFSIEEVLKWATEGDPVLYSTPEATIHGQDGDGGRRAPFVPSFWYNYVVAWLLAIAIFLLTCGNGNVVEGQVRQDLHGFTISVMGALTVLGLAPPHRN